MPIKTVIKSNGVEVPFDAEKLNKMAEWGDTLGIGWSDIVLDTVKRLTDRCTTSEIQNALIDSCSQKQTTQHLAMAARILLGTLYKQAHKGFESKPHLYDFYKDMTLQGVWDEMEYCAVDLEYLNDFLDYDKDLSYTFTTLKQVSSKYCKKYKGVIAETPQLAFMGIAMAACEGQPCERRLGDVLKCYEYLSDLKINQPTPFLAGLRTKNKGFASCAVLKADDTADSIEALVHSAYVMTCNNAGIGSQLTTRSVKDAVRNGAITHTGKLPYYRYLQGAVKSTKQDVRGGSSTVHYNMLDPEIEDLLRLKHPTSVDDKKIRGLDYSVGVNRYFAEKAARNEDWMLCSYLHAPDIHEAMYGDYDTFKTLYEKYESSDKPRRTVSAMELLKLTLKNRLETGRVYIHWCDEMNHHTPFKDKIYSSNL